MTTEYTPTTTDIRDGFSLNYSRDYEDFSDGYYDALRFGEGAFTRWLAEYTRQQREESFNEGVNAGWIGTNRTLPSILSDNPYREDPR